jgi:NADH-quinone oxidoreductase subunit H
VVASRTPDQIFGFDGLGNPYMLTQFVAFVVFMIAVQAELTQTPFDMPIAESELVSGYMTEYSRLPLPHLLHRRVRHRRCVRTHRQRAVPRRLGCAVQLVRLGCLDPGSIDNWMNVGGPLIMFTKMMVLSASSCGSASATPVP